MAISSIYTKFRTIIDAVHVSEIDASKAWDQLIDLLEEAVGLRPESHDRTNINYSFCDNGEFKKEILKDLAVGFVYKKPNSEPTCDTFVINLSGKIVRLKTDKDLRKRCPRLEWKHKIKVLKVS